MASSRLERTHQIQEDLLRCEVCFEMFNTSDLKPYILPCFHSFCGPCIATMGHRGDFSCPVCRTVVSFHPAKPPADQLRVDHTRIKLIDLTQGATGGDQPTTPKVDPNKFCSEHSQKKKLLCLVCCEPVCRKCLVLHHEGHDTVKVSSKCPDTQRELLLACRELAQFIGNAQLVNQAASFDLKEVESRQRAVIEKMEQGFRDLVKAIFKREHQALCRFEQRALEDKLPLSSLLSSQDSVLSQARAIADSARVTVAQGTDADMSKSVIEIWTFLVDSNPTMSATPLCMPQYEVSEGGFKAAVKELPRCGEFIKRADDGSRDGFLAAVLDSTSVKTSADPSDPSAANFDPCPSFSRNEEPSSRRNSKIESTPVLFLPMR